MADRTQVAWCACPPNRTPTRRRHGIRPSRGRAHRGRPHPVRHQQLRRRQRQGRAGGGRVRRRLPREPRARARVLRADPSPHQRDGARARPRSGASRRSSCTATSTSCRGRRGVDGRPVRGRRARRPAVGPRRRGHEEHGRDDPDSRRRPPSRGGAAGARPHPGVLRRRGERRRRGLAARRQHSARVVRRRDRGDQRGRRILDLRRRPPRLPAAGRREGPDLDPPPRARAGRPRQPLAPRQRHHAPRGGRRRARPHRVAGAAHRHDRRHCSRARRHQRRRTTDDPDALAADDGRGRRLHPLDPAHHDQSDGTHRRLQAQRHPGHGRGAHRRARAAGHRGRGPRRHPAHRRR